MNTPESKRVLGEAVSAAISELHPQRSGVLTRFVVIAEIALPDDRSALVRLTSDAAGFDLRPWDAHGFLANSLINHGAPPES